MKINHYATIFTNKNVIPEEKTTRVKSNDIHSLPLTKDSYRVITFDRMVNEIEYNGKIYPVATRKLNQKIYHIGKYEDLSSLANKDELFVKIAKNNECIGMVTSYSGLESMVFEGEGIVDIFNKKEIVLKECSLNIDEEFYETAEQKENEKIENETTIDTSKKDNIDDKNSDGSNDSSSNDSNTER